MTQQLQLFDPANVMGRHTETPVRNPLPDIQGQPPAVNVDTSLAAADRVRSLPKTKRDETSLLMWVQARKGYGATDDEIKAHFGWDGDYERPRRWTLAKHGLISKTALRRMTADGNPAIVWVENNVGMA